ncbi:3-phytase A [Lachnellula suecica]|uniref:3-phytase A n=1 Tax=Lachnellula suecica TaxID=602035 RepID=A0A8T9CH15_9HELO|nr:3-phytase A [Lachnellula suecica]
MVSFNYISQVLLVSAVAVSVRAEELLTDITKIQRNWGQLSPYADNPEDIFGVGYVGLPDGCQIESVQTLQRHAQRFATSYIDDGANDQRFATKISNFTSASNSLSSFSGPLSFLNSYRYPLVDTGLLVGKGAVTEMTAGVSFWNRYGRTLYNASVGQLAYNASFPNGIARDPVVLRTTSQSRIENSQINWALGFFGSSFQTVPNPSFTNITKPFEVVIITEGGSENNTLASYDSCFSDYDATLGYLGDLNLLAYIPKYLPAATARMQKYAPEGFAFNVNDTYAMQSICAYEHAYIGMSSFCELFTAEEWSGFENTLDMEYYYDYSYGNPTGRAQGVGYAQELLARLNHTVITSSSSSVNSTLDDNTETFPTDQAFYADFSHDDILVSVLTALSVDYFYDPPSLTQFPPNPNRHFILSQLTPFGANLITETIGCSSSNPDPVEKSRVSYTPGQYGYDSANASHKFIRMRLNNGIVPLNTIRGGACGNSTTGRVDGMCAKEDFVASQANSTTLANYQYACFGNYTVTNVPGGKDYDGTIFE